MIDTIASTYRRFVLGRPRAVLIVLLALLAFFAYHAPDFQLDASADSLLLEDDEDLRIFRQVQARYRTKDLLVVTFTPPGELFSDAPLAALKRLRDELKALASVDSVTTILDVPLLKSSDVSLSDMAKNVQTLEKPNADRQRAKQEILSSHVYKNLLLSDDGQTTALLIRLVEDATFDSLQTARQGLLAKKRAGSLAAQDSVQLARVLADYDRAHAALSEGRHQDIATIRTIIERYTPHASLHLGGVPMITDDMITFIKRDLVVFGTGVLLFLIVVLSVIFGRLHWVLLPLISCFYAGLVMIGMLGLIGWKVTVISSNFLALMLIITISMNIHLAVRYRQLRRDFPDMEHLERVDITVRKMVWPCLYTALTTIIGFSSLVVSDIKPVMDFGWMMSIGRAVTFLTSFSLFPAVLLLLDKGEEDGTSGREFRFTARLATLTERHGNKVLAVAALLAVISALGISRLTVENSFIDYFSKRTEIYKGMKLIDQKLGGTTPLEVLLDLDEDRIFGEEEAGESGDKAPDGEAEEEEDIVESEQDIATYWFTPFKVERIKAIHDYLDSLPEVGKVLSLASVIRVAEDLNDGKELDSLALALIYRRVPDDIKESLISPYVSFKNNEARLFLRVVDSRETLRRKELLERIRGDLSTRLELGKDDFTVTGLLVLYNNMLQSLYTSQISTLGVVLVGVGAMFLILFRSLALALIGLVPNLLAAAVVLGMMGLAGIPLDMMTITIAAITIGIAVDNSIHYIYRFREEYAKNGDYIQTLHICHSNIGKAVLYTSCTIIFGFSILVLSNFFPTIYFGVLTGLAMAIALLAALTLLPKFILVWRPF